MKWYSNDKKTKPNLSQSKTGDVDGMGMRLANLRIRTRAGWMLGITLYLLHCKMIRGMLIQISTWTIQQGQIYYTKISVSVGTIKLPLQFDHPAELLPTELTC